MAFISCVFGHASLLLGTAWKRTLTQRKFVPQRNSLEFVVCLDAVWIDEDKKADDSRRKTLGLKQPPAAMREAGRAAGG
jgi:hypothetical protein